MVSFSRFLVSGLHCFLPAQPHVSWQQQRQSQAFLTRRRPTSSMKRSTATSPNVAAATAGKKARSDTSTAVKSTPTSMQECLASLSREALSIQAAADNIEERTKEMERRAKVGEPFTEQELEDAVESLKYLTPKDDDSANDIGWNDFRRVLKEIAHISHKDWTVTSSNAQKLLPFLIPERGTDFPGPLSACRYSRILADGNWAGAVQHAATASSSDEPWAVLVTGVNGIRKTTSLYQPWFGSLLEEALVPPSGSDTEKGIPAASLPTGSNSFFRQLDHMIATLCNKDFATLYALTEKRLSSSVTNEEQSSAVTPSAELIQAYSNLKAAIFTRFRTLSELFGVLLLQQAQQKKINCLMETSGRDVAMFQYVDYVFPPGAYRKLALHFVITDLSYAQSSVDGRMVDEIRTGIQAIQAGDVVDVLRVIDANAGGPYGSEVLPGVQEASEAVWKKVVDGSAGVGDDWFKATIQINAHGSEPWTAQAVKADGTLGTLHTFERVSK